MKYWIESTWDPWVPFPQTIEEVHEAGKIRGADGQLLEQIQESAGQGMFSLDPSPLDYIVRNSDNTTSLGFYQTNVENARKWVAWRNANLSPGQIESILVVVPEEGDDPSLAQLSYADRLAANSSQGPE